MQEQNTTKESTIQTKEKTDTNEAVSMRQLLECGVHFGHQTKRWNPKMKKFIFTARNGIHVIDLQQTMQIIKNVYDVVSDIVKKNGTILFVGTKKQAQEAIKDEATRCGMPYVHHRWLGGTLTNISTIRQSINKLNDFIRLENDGILTQLSNKEQSKRRKSYNKLLYNLEGIKDMIQTPAALFVVDTNKEQLAIKEATRLNIPIIGIVDTNANPNEVQYPIPANDDAIRAVKLLCSVIANAVIEGKDKQIKYAEEAQKAAEQEKTKTQSKNKTEEAKTEEAKEKEKPKTKESKTK